MQGGGPSPSGSNFRHSYGLAAVSSAQTSAKGRLPGVEQKQIKIHITPQYTDKIKSRKISYNFISNLPSLPPIAKRNLWPTRAITCP